MDNLFLMCLNKPIYNITTEEVLNFECLPGLLKNMACNYTYQLWMERRRACDSNSIARKLREKVFGYSIDYEYIDRITHALSLSDCYWVKLESENLLFEEISPYYNEFYKGEGLYDGDSIPTLYLNGALPKEWISANEMYKYGDLDIEKECLDICKKCRIFAATAEKRKNGIVVKNMTTPVYMLETGDLSGRISEDFVPMDLIEMIGERAFDMLLIDVIVGNGDRHWGNFGWFRNSKKGSIENFAPLFDFDHALDSSLESDAMFSDITYLLYNYSDYIFELERISDIIQEIDCKDIFKKRTENLMNLCIKLGFI